MRDDILDARSAIDWAKSYIPTIEQQIKSYVRKRPYSLLAEPDPGGTGDQLLIAYNLGPPDPLLNAAIGATINSIRSSLDILFFALIGRHQRARDPAQSSSAAKFPFESTEAKLGQTLAAHRRRGWLTQEQSTRLESTQPFAGGNITLYALHQLDIIRKHRRLIEIRPKVEQLFAPSDLPCIVEHRIQEDKTILLRMPGHISPGIAESVCDITTEVGIHEPALGLYHRPVVSLLLEFAHSAEAVIRLFS